jgi:hypothetical protein
MNPSSEPRPERLIAEREELRARIVAHAGWMS